MSAKTHVAFKMISGAYIIGCATMRTAHASPRFLIPSAFDALDQSEKCTHCQRELARKRAKAAKAAKAKDSA